MADLDWTQPLPAKKKMLPLKLKKKKRKSTNRFGSPDKSSDTYQQPFIPENTKVNTRWAVKNFEDWAASYNLRHPEEKCPDDVLLCDNPAELSLLQKYVLSTRKKTEGLYPPCTIHLLLSGIQRFMRENKQHSFNLFCNDTPEFKQLMTTCDTYYRKLREQGMGAAAKPTQVLTDDETEILWASGILSSSTPEGLLNAVFFCNGKNFLLRGGTEHRSLKLSQVVKNVLPKGESDIRILRIHPRIEPVACVSWMFLTRLFTNLRILSLVSAAMSSCWISTCPSCPSQPRRMMCFIIGHLEKFQAKKIRHGFHPFQLERII